MMEKAEMIEKADMFVRFNSEQSPPLPTIDVTTIISEVSQCNAKVI